MNVSLHGTAGKVLEFVLLSWLYAFYCFDYKWVLMKKPLAARIALFESQWAFYGGFGAVCTLATVPTSFYVGAAVMAVLFPLFILMACDTSPRDHMQQGNEMVHVFPEFHRSANHARFFVRMPSNRNTLALA